MVTNARFAVTHLIHLTLSCMFIISFPVLMEVQMS